MRDLSYTIYWIWCIHALHYVGVTGKSEIPNVLPNRTRKIPCVRSRMADRITGRLHHIKGDNAMATSACQAAIPAYSGLESTIAIAAVLGKTAGAASTNRPFVRDVSNVFFGLYQRGLRFPDLGLRKIPGGYYSEDVESFVGQLLSLGYATQRSPIKLTPEGEKFCREIEERAQNRDDLIKLHKELEELLQGSPAPA